MAATLHSRLPQIAAQLRPRVSAAVKVGAEGIAEGARNRVPVGAPDVHLRDAIHVERSGPAEYAVIAGDEQAWYGHFLEFGTSHSAPRPFLIPAVEANQDGVTQLVTAALRRL